MFPPPLALPFTLLTLISSVLAQGSPEDYAPNVNQSCPDITTAPLVRVFTPQNQSLHPGEESFVSERLASVIPQAWSDWLGDGSGIGYNLSAFGNESAKIGISISGGGYRAAQYGAGVLSALDARNQSAKHAGTGGFLQVTSYLSGLSGGSWITGSLYFNDWPTLEDMVFGNDQLSGWLLDIDLATPDGDDLFSEKNQYFYGSILWSVIAKANKSIDTSITDPWARMISYHFLNQTTRDNFFTNDTAHGAGQLWSQIPNIPAYQSHQTPFPLIMADSRPAGSNSTGKLPPEPTVYEITPFEFGSWDPNLSAMVNMTYIGTHLTNGEPDNNTACVTAFDQAGFMMGTSASLFNQVFDAGTNELDKFGSDGSGIVYSLERQLRSVRTRADDVADWPSPFHGIKNDTFEDSDSTWLELVDGSTNGENVPLGPMFVKARGLDTIVAVDGSADDANAWPNGSSILHTQFRLANVLNTSHQLFPPIPSSPEEFISTGVRQRPTFFGCNPTQIPPEFPLVIYLPNSPPLNGDDPVTNTGTFKIDYTPLHSRIFVDQAHANTIGGFLPKSESVDPNWGQCLQCAAIDRSRFKLSPVIPRSDFCSKCFFQYCFEPTSPPDGAYIIGRKLVFVDPDPQGFSKLADFFADNKLAFIGGLVGLIVLVACLIGFLIWRKKRSQKAAQAKYQEIALYSEEREWTSGASYDPYEEKDFRTPTNQIEFHVDAQRDSYIEGTVATAYDPTYLTPRGEQKDLYTDFHSRVGSAETDDSEGTVVGEEHHEQDLLGHERTV
ncbi:hypothetical protein PHLCEN_2v8427 [Hermanssonia centrifuga]|uniref:Lysophospholipase n=1 Tax=Hermanssonia centrifuga TaxID=98765 RepID=A0A2R6NTS3_9APHY|nr:hypothetical protein PHLCEN_2v8427 [Hermanssonia centrifuga]